MQYVSCKQCGTEIYETEQMCPKCGTVQRQSEELLPASPTSPPAENEETRPVRQVPVWYVAIPAALLLVALIVIVGMMNRPPKQNPPRPTSGVTPPSEQPPVQPQPVITPQSEAYSPPTAQTQPAVTPPPASSQVPADTATAGSSYNQPQPSASRDEAKGNNDVSGLWKDVGRDGKSGIELFLNQNGSQVSGSFSIIIRVSGALGSESRFDIDSGFVRGNRIEFTATESLVTVFGSPRTASGSMRFTGIVQGNRMNATFVYPADNDSHSITLVKQ